MLSSFSSVINGKDLYKSDNLLSSQSFFIANAKDTNVSDNLLSSQSFFIANAKDRNLTYPKLADWSLLFAQPGKPKGIHMFQIIPRFAELQASGGGGGGGSTDPQSWSDA